MSDRQIPKEAIQALKIAEELFDDALAAVYLYGSAVMGGLQRDSDVDIMVLTDRDLSERDRRDLTARLMEISGRPGNAEAVRSLEVTVINRNNVVPWRYPPRQEFMYGEWL